MSLGGQGHGPRWKAANETPGKVWESKKDIWSLSPVPGAELLKSLEFLGDKGGRYPFYSDQVTAPSQLRNGGPAVRNAKP